MAEIPTKQKLYESLEDHIDRSNFQQIVEQIYSSLKTADWADDYVQGLAEKLERASQQEQRGLREKIGILSFGMGHYQTAAEHLERVKTRKEASHFLGRAYIELDRTEEVKQALEAGRQGNDDFATDMLLADLLCRRREDGAARKICNKYRKSHSDEPDWLYATGRVLETEGCYGEAMAHYEQALERDPDHPKSLFRLALNCNLNGEDERAVELYQKCASQRPTFLGTLINLGVLYEDGGHYERAVECYKRVLALDPSHERAQLYLKDAEASLTMRIDEERTRRILAQDEALQISLFNFELSARSRSVLEKLNVHTLGDLSRITEEDLLQFKNFGETSLDEIKDLLARNDLQLVGSRPPIAARAKQLGTAAESEDLQEKLSMPVEVLSLSTRSRRCVERLNISMVGELTERTEKDLLSAPNFGRTSVAEIKSKLAALDLSLSEQ